MSAHLNAVCVGSYCIDGAHLDSLDHVLTETKKKHTQTGEVSTTNVHHVKETFLMGGKYARVQCS